MARRGRKIKLSMPGKLESNVMHWHGIKLTDEPPLPGHLTVQYTRHSNRPNCRCNRKRKLHGPYYYRVWTDAVGQRHKEYVPLDNVRSVLARLRQYRIENARLPCIRSFWRLYRGQHPLGEVRPRDLRRKWTVLT